MKVCIYPPTHGSGLGEQFRQTTACLSARGIEWFLASDASSSFEVAHLFSLPDLYTSLENFLRARRAGARVVVTPIYWNPTRFYREGLPLVDSPSGAQAELNTHIREATIHAERAIQQFILGHADVLVPLSPSEAAQLTRDFGVDPMRIIVAPNGVDPIFASATPDAFVKKYGLRDKPFVLCAARADARKNQLSLIRALRDDASRSAPLVLAGGSVAPRYLEMCERAAGPNVHFLPSLAPEELASAYAAAKVHALVSWYDCAPLAALEAGAAGCNLVLTTESGARDYCGDAAWYCDPGDLSLIRRAVNDALNAPRRDDLRARILKEYTWDNAARATNQAYECAVSREPQAADESFHDDLEKATIALAELVPLVENSRAELWQEKSALAQTVEGYQNGRVMRVLNWLSRAGRDG